MKRPRLSMVGLLAGFLGFISIYAYPTPANFDGPAELPRVLVHSAITDTPAPGKVITVHAGENLQAAIDRASCGDRVELQAGATFTGAFRFSQKPCDDAHWIIVRTAAPESELPAEGTRLKPCFAGVASLPGRPDFHCTSTQNVMAKIEFPVTQGNGPLIFREGANHYRFIGLEITRTARGRVSALASADQNAQANHLIFDRVWMHGDPQAETTRAIALTGMSYAAVVDSFFTDFHCTAMTGSCTDAQVISCGGGNAPSGPFKIFDNFLESSGENILFGGGPATNTPTDFEIRGNHFFKPLTWRPGEPGFVAGESGKPFIVKNLFELKNAQRVLLEGNILENSWGGFSQKGFAIVLTPKNQGGRCPTCRVTDVTIRYNLILNVGSVFLISNGADAPGQYSSAGERYSIHDMVAQNVRGEQYDGSGLFALIAAASPPLRDVRIEHVSAFVPRAAFSIMNTTGRFENFHIENNLLSTGELGLVSSGGGQQNCAEQAGSRSQGRSLDGAVVFGNCFTNSSFAHNLLIGEGDWPKGNISAKDGHSAGLHESGQMQRPYILCTHKDGECKKASPALHAASDGKDLGADLGKLNLLIANAW